MATGKKDANERPFTPGKGSENKGTASKSANSSKPGDKPGKAGAPPKVGKNSAKGSSRPTSRKR